MTGARLAGAVSVSERGEDVERLTDDWALLCDPSTGLAYVEPVEWQECPCGDGECCAREWRPTRTVH